MNKETLISEGHLLPYITSEVDDALAKEIEQLIATDKEVQREYYSLQKQIEHLCFHYALTPENAAKRLLMEAEEVMPWQHGLPPHTSMGFNKWAVASAVILLSAMISMLYLWNQWQDASIKLADYEQQNQWLTDNYNRVTNDLESMENYLGIASDPLYQRIVLQGTPNAPNARAIVYWNPQSQDVYLNSDQLSELNQDQQYQLWAIIDGKPVDAGIFDPSSRSLLSMKSIANAQAFAVTIEPAGGSENPTLSSMQVYAPV